MEKNFKRMYQVMGIIGEVLGLVGAALLVFKNQTIKNDFFILFIILFVFLIGARILKNMVNKKKIKGISQVDAAIVKGHLSMMFGVGMLITSLMHTTQGAFVDTLVITLIIIAFMTFMMMFMIKTFARLKKAVEESEKK